MRPFERLGMISELHYGQLVSAFKRNDQTVLKSELADILCVPTFSEKSTTDETLMLVTRYESAQLPRRDAQFLSKVQTVLMQGLEVSNARDARKTARDNLGANLRMMAASIREFADQAVVQGIVDTDLGMSCYSLVYLLHTDGKTFVQV